MLRPECDLENEEVALERDVLDLLYFSCSSGLSEMPLSNEASENAYRSSVSSSITRAYKYLTSHCVVRARWRAVFHRIERFESAPHRAEKEDAGRSRSKGKGKITSKQNNQGLRNKNQPNSQKTVQGSIAGANHADGQTTAHSEKFVYLLLLLLTSVS